MGFTPQSRFTIIRANKDERQMAIAIKERNEYQKLKHEIYITNDGVFDKKIMSLADDLIQCIESRGKLGNEAESKGN